MRAWEEEEEEEDDLADGFRGEGALMDVDPGGTTSQTRSSWKGLVWNVRLGRGSRGWTSKGAKCRRCGFLSERVRRCGRATIRLGSVTGRLEGMGTCRLRVRFG